MKRHGITIKKFDKKKTREKKIREKDYEMNTIKKEGKLMAS